MAVHKSHRRRRRMGSSAAVAVLDPTTIAGLKLWVAADKMVTDLDAANDGDLVSTWTDHSGGSVALAAATTARPAYKTSVLNSLPVVRFDGTTDRLAGTTAALLNVQKGDDLACTVIVCAIPAAGNYFFSWGNTGGSSPAVATVYQDEGGGEQNLRWDQTDNAALNSTIQSSRDDSFDKAVGNVTTFKFTGTAITGYKNGTIVTGMSAVASNIGTKANLNSYAIGCLHRSADTAFYGGDIAEMLIYDTALSDANRGAVEAYLGTKYGVTVAN